MASDVHRRANLSLLTASDPPPATLLNPEGRSPFLFIGDHAGNVIPSRLGSIGLAKADLERHIAWDIGVGGLGTGLAETMDATFIRQTYSRLVIDCNRDPRADDSVATVSDGTIVPGNADLPDHERAARLREVHEPYQQMIAREIARRLGVGRPTVIVALHSFTPALADKVPRPWHVGVLHDGGDASFAQTLLRELRGDASQVVGDNEPYRMDATDYTIPRHCYAALLPYVELEVRQDLIRSQDGRSKWAAALARSLDRALAGTS